MLYYTTFTTPYWEICLVGNDDGLTNLHLFTGEGKRELAINPHWEQNHALFAEAEKQLQEYFQGKRKRFDLALNPQGTEFQKTVWKVLCNIPYGETRSYKELAETLGKPNGARAVGTANGKNPIALIIPCHRVIAGSGKLAGFAHGLAAKQALLELEQKSR